MSAGMVIILLLEIYVQIYVLKRVLICTVYQKHGSRTRERVIHLPVPVKSVPVQTYRLFARMCPRSGNGRQQRVC